MENELQEEEITDLPSFMSEEQDDDAENLSVNWFANNLHKIMAGVSVFWFLIVGIYITKFYGWSNMFLLTPGEFGGFLAGTTLPLAVIWMVIAYIDRGSGFKTEAKLLRAYMNQLVYPEEGAATTAKAMADAIREQVSELQEVTKLATEKTNEIKTELSSRVDDFAKLMQVLNDYSNKTINELNIGVSALIENCNFVTSQTKSITEEFLNSADNIKTKVGDLTVGITPMLQDVRNMAIMLNDLINDNQKKIISANERFNEYSNLFSHLNENILQIEQSIKTQRQAVAEQAEILDKNSKYLDGKLGEYGRLIGMEVEAMVNSSTTMDDSIQHHIQQLKTVSAEISDVFNAVYQEINKKSDLLMSSSKANARNIVASSKVLDDEIYKLQNFAETANRKNVELREIAEKTASKLETIGQRITENTDILKVKALETLDAFDLVSGNIKTNTQALLEVSGQISEHARKGDVTLLKQTDRLSVSAKSIKDSEQAIMRINELLEQAEGKLAAALATYEKTLKSLKK